MAGGAPSRGNESSSTTTSLTASSGFATRETDDPNDLPEPEELITETAMEALRLALDNVADMQRLLEADGLVTEGSRHYPWVGITSE